MKTSFALLLIIVFTAISCEKQLCGCSPVPFGSELHGNWEFVRVNYGFSNTSRTASELGYTERLEIDTTNERLRRYRNDKEVETTLFLISEEGTSKVITFEEEKTYSYYTIFEEDDKVMLSLYERSPVGAVLADGGVYYYEKSQQ